MRSRCPRLTAQRILTRCSAQPSPDIDAASTLNPPAERVGIPYEDATMPGYLFRPSTSDDQRRTLIMNNGSDAPVTSIWPPVSAGGVARGYNVLVFDGPGQQSMLFGEGRAVPP